MTPTVDHVLLNIALNLSSNRSHEQQYQNLIDGVAQVFPCDASCLFIFDEDGFLTPVAVKGLSSSVLGRRYFPKAHPRLDAIIHSREPVRFDADCSLPDPFDGTLLTEDQCIDVHDCMGFSLYVEGLLVGALTMDALTVGAFDDIDPVAIETFAALTAATLRNIAQLKALKAQNQKQKKRHSNPYPTSPLSTRRNGGLKPTDQSITKQHCDRCSIRLRGTYHRRDRYW